ELRLASSFPGPLNFSIGANFTRFKARNEYYVMNNVLTLLTMGPMMNRSGTWTECGTAGFIPVEADPPVPMEDPDIYCPYIDPNPFHSLNGDGHNYYRSSIPYRLTSLAGFGELYWEVNDTLRLTAGLRYTEDRKTFTPVPTQLLLARMVHGGSVI